MTDRQTLEEINRRLAFIQSMAHSSGGGSVLSSVMACKELVTKQLATRPGGQK